MFNYIIFLIVSIISTLVFFGSFFFLLLSETERKGMQITMKITNIVSLIVLVMSLSFVYYYLIVIGI